MMTLPEDFTQYTRKLMGDSLYGEFAEALQAEPPTSIRINPLKGATPPKEGAEAVSWCPWGYYLARRPAFTFDPLLHAGLYYVQEASSMFITYILRQLVHAPAMMLDLCAAPGGKTTAARTALPAGSLLVANEPMKLRANVLAENVGKLGHPDTLVTCNYPKDFKKAGLLFDVILTDVPCSGEGMFRKEEAAVSQWSTQLVSSCQQLQRSIVEDIWPCLRPGGLLIYSTCTYNAHEDEENVAWVAQELGATFVRIDTPADWHITGPLVGEPPVCRFIPGKTRGEGLFMAVLRKGGEALSIHTGNKRKHRPMQRKDKPSPPSSLLKEVQGWLEGDFQVVQDGDSLRAIPRDWLPVYEKASRNLHILQAGVTLGTMKGKSLVPDAALALSVALKQNAFPKAELGHADALRYLRKESITLAQDTPQGFVLLTYRGHALGFVKNLGNRANNLYPQGWKIKTTHLPDTPVEVLD